MLVLLSSDQILNTFRHMKKMLAIAFLLLFCFGKAQSQLESLMQNFTNDYAVKNVKLTTAYDPVITFVIGEDTVIKHNSSNQNNSYIYENDSLIALLEELVKGDISIILPYLESEEHDFAVNTFLYHYYGEVFHIWADRSPVLWYPMDKSKGTSYFVNTWKEHRKEAISKWKEFLIGKGYISE